MTWTSRIPWWGWLIVGAVLGSMGLGVLIYVLAPVPDGASAYVAGGVSGTVGTALVQSALRQKRVEELAAPTPVPGPIEVEDRSVEEILALNEKLKAELAARDEARRG